MAGIILDDERIFFFRVMTEFQYIEDCEPVVDGSRNHLYAVL